MLQGFLQQHNAMRNQLPNPSSRRLHHCDSRKIDESVRNELSVLKRTTITRRRQRAKLACIGSTQHVEQALLATLQAHHDKMHFEHVILARFTIKCAQRREQLMAQRGRALGINIFKKLKLMSAIKRRLHDLMRSKRLALLRYCWLQWHQRFKYTQNRRRYVYSIVRTRHLQQVQKRTRQVCVDLWRSYTTKIICFKHGLWRVALDIQQMASIFAGWREEIVQLIKLRCLLQCTLTSRKHRMFFSWREQIKKQLELRQKILQKMRHRQLANGYKTWAEKAAGAKRVAVHLQRLYCGRKGRRRHAAQREVALCSEELRKQDEEEACRAEEESMEEKLKHYLKKTFRGRYSLHQMFVVIRRLDGAHGRGSVVNLCRSYVMARSALLKGGREYARSKAAIRFQRNRPPKHKCSFCFEGFALYSQLVKHESRNECENWWSERAQDEDGVTCVDTTKDTMTRKILGEILLTFEGK
jgi:hypothetical protein